MTLFRAAFLAFLSLLSAPAYAQTGVQARVPTGAPEAAPAPAGDGEWLYRGSDIARDPAWHFGTLPNGLRYAVRRNALPAGQVSIRIRIDAGSLHERDDERGWAHFVEHMMFRGTERYPDQQARQIWQQLGASFGSDTNARTDPTDTVYQLDLPHADRASLDTSLNVLSEMMAHARFEPAAVTAERPVVLAEKARRSELSVRLQEVVRPLYYSGVRFANRDPIGVDETLNAATADGLRAFYRRWYRPERATIVMVGDADPAMMEELIRARFGGWLGTGPAPTDPDYGLPTEPANPIASLTYPGVPTSVNVAWLRPYEVIPHTMARERLFLEDLLAASIVNRRLEAHARGRSAFIGAAIGSSRQRNIVNSTTLALTAHNGSWRQAMEEAFAIITDALRAPPSTVEIDREIQNLRTGVTAAVQGEATARSQNRAEQLIGAIDGGAVVATAQTVLDNFERNAPEMTPIRVGAAMQRLFQGMGPRMLVVTPEPIEGSDAALAAGLAAARAAAPATRTTLRRVSFNDLPSPGRPGREISREHIADMDVTIVRFANGATLTFKHTDFERGSVQVRLRFGGGVSAMAPDRPSFAWLSGLIAPSGLARLDLDGMERLLTGRRMGLGFAVDEDAFVLAGQTNTADLSDQLRLLTVKLTHPRWDSVLFARFRSAAVESFDLHFSSASARAARELGGVLRPADERWRPIDKNEMANVTVNQFRDFYTPLLASGPVHAVIVGDTDLETAVAAMRRTVAALPRRPETRIPANSLALRPPVPNPEPRGFTHSGDPNQAYAVIGWSTRGGTDNIRDRRALALAANMFETRLFDRLREQEGATYAPNAVSVAADTFPAWGVLYAAAEIRPGSAATFFRIGREIITDLATHAALPDEFARAQNPVLSGIERRVATNAYWIDAMEDWDHDPREIANVRSYLADYRGMTAEDVRRAVATYVTDQGDWSMLVLPARTQAPTTAAPPAPTAQPSPAG